MNYRQVRNFNPTKHDYLNYLRGICLLEYSSLEVKIDYGRNVTEIWRFQFNCIVSAIVILKQRFSVLSLDSRRRRRRHKNINRGKRCET